MRQAIVIEGDTHGGQKFGLMDPEIKFDVIDSETGDITGEKYTPAATQGQLELWKLRQDNIQNLSGIIDNYGKVVYLHNGDLTQGVKHPCALVSTRQADQITIAAGNMIPMMEIEQIHTARFASGTEAHNFWRGDV